MPILLKNKSQATGALYTAAIALYLTLSAVGGAILSALPQESFARTAISPLFAAVALFSISFLSKKAYKTVGSPSKKDDGKYTYGAIFGYKRFKPAYLLAAIFLAAGVFCGLGFINAAFAELLSKIGVNLPNNELKINGAGEYIILSLSLAVVPAIAEETFFRGAIAYGASGAKLFAGAAFSGLIFALYHCSLSQLIYQFIYGAILYILAKKAGSVFPSAVAHFLNNFAIITLTFLKIEVNLFSPVLIASGIAALIIAAVLIFFAERITAKSVEDKNASEAENGSADERKDKFSAKDFFLPFGAVGVLACAIMGAASLL